MTKFYEYASGNQKYVTINLKGKDIIFSTDRNIILLDAKPSVKIVHFYQDGGKWKVFKHLANEKCPGCHSSAKRYSKYEICFNVLDTANYKLHMVSLQGINPDQFIAEYQQYAPIEFDLQGYHIGEPIDNFSISQRLMPNTWVPSYSSMDAEAMVNFYANED